MVTIKSTEHDQLQSVEDRLVVSFADRVSRQDVHERVQRVYDSFAEAAVRTYVPLLVFKIVSDGLRASPARAVA